MAGLFRRLFGLTTRQPTAEVRSSGYDRLLTMAYAGNGLNLTAGISEETALSVSAVYAAVDRISSSLASVPFNVYERAGDGRRLARDNDQFYLVHTQPSPLYTSYQFRKILISHALLWGNGYALLVRDTVTTRPKEYRILHPSQVTDIKAEQGELFYFIDGMRDPVPHYDILHITASGQLLKKDNYFGKSPIRLHAETIGAAKERNTYQATAIRNGGFLSGVMKFAQSLKPEQKEAIRESWRNKHGGAGNAGSMLILDNGVDYQQLTMNPEDAQLVETLKFSVEDIARIYGIPPHMIGHLERSTNNNIEHQAIEYVQYCLMPWATLIEQVFDSRIFRIAEKTAGRFYTKLELNALMRGDVTARKEYYMAMLDRGVFDIDEVRALEDMNPVENGKMRLVQGNMIPLGKIDEHYEKMNNGSADTQP